jgi:hypothetical protein
MSDLLYLTTFILYRKITQNNPDQQSGSSLLSKKNMNIRVLFSQDVKRLLPELVTELAALFRSNKRSRSKVKLSQTSAQEITML